MTFLAKTYWEERYSVGGNSGSGSRGKLARRKADYISETLRRLGVASVVDWGCGDGTLLSLLDLGGVDYVGVDVSASGLAACAHKRSDRPLVLWRDTTAVTLRAEAAMSIDILFHFPDDSEYDTYLRNLFGSAERYVLVHNCEAGEEPAGEHVRWRRVSEDVASRFPSWKLIDTAPGVNGCEFTLYENER